MKGAVACLLAVSCLAAFNPPASCQTVNDYLGAAQVSENMGNWAAAERAYMMALQLDPTNANTYLGIGLLYMNGGQFNNALIAFGKALEIKPNDSMCLSAAGVTNIFLGNFPQAIQFLEKAASADPRSPLPHLNLGYTYYRMGQYEKALNEYDQSLSLKGPSTERGMEMAGKASTLAAMNRFAEAKAAKDEALTAFQAYTAEQKANSLQLLVEAASAASMMGNNEEALNIITPGFSVTPLNIHSRARLLAVRGYIYARMGKQVLSDADIKLALSATSESSSIVRDFCERASSTGTVAQQTTSRPPAITPAPATTSSVIATAAPRKTAGNVNRPITDKWALVVGVSNFADQSIPKLQYAAKDAEDFANFLVDKCQFRRDHVRVLLNEQATQRRILEELGDKYLPRVASKDDLVVFFFSSHGSPAKVDVRGKNYLIAHDSTKTSLFASGIELQDLTQLLKERVQSDRVLIVLDACHSGAADASAKASESAGNFDAMAVAGQGQLVICSSQADERSWESRRYANGIFTKRLMEGLTKSGQGTKLKDAFQYLEQIVSEEVRQDQAVKQTPILKSEWDGNDIMLAAPVSSARPMPPTIRQILTPDSLELKGAVTQLKPALKK